MFPDVLDTLMAKGFVRFSLLERVGALRQPKDLSQVLLQCPIEWRSYIFGQSRRSQLYHPVYTVSEYDPKQVIPTHHELSYTNHPPRWLVFYAHHPAREGSMRLLDGRRVAEEMAADKRWSSYLNAYLSYHKCMPTEPRLGMGKTWCEHFETSEKNVVERYCVDNEIQFEWLQGGALLSTHHRRPTCRTDESGQPVWYSQPRLWHMDYRGLSFFRDRVSRNQWPTAVRFDDESEIPLAFLHWLDRIEMACAATVHLAKGELLIVDNHRVAHGRTAFHGNREHWVSMGDGAWVM